MYIKIEDDMRNMKRAVFSGVNQTGTLHEKIVCLN